MSTERTPKSDKELWQSLVFDPSPAPESVSDLDFAAWLEGRLPEARAAEVDAAIAADPALRRSAVELSEILGMPLPAVSPRIAVRAQALVGFAVEKQASRGSWLAAVLPSFGGGFSLQRGAMAGLAMVIATVGFVMGGGLGESFATEKYATVQSTTSAPLGVDTSGQLNDLFTDSL